MILVWTGFALGRFASRADVEIAASSGWHVTLGIVANVLITASFLAMFLRRMRVLEIAAGASFLAVALIHQVPSGLSLLRMILER